MIQAENLEKVFNLPSSSDIIEGEYVVENKELEVPNNTVAIVKPKQKLDDSDYIRSSLIELADSTKEALELALQIQAEDPNARNTEAVAKMADAVSKALGNLLHLNKTEKDVEHKIKEPQEQNAPKVINNTLILTTEDLISKIITQRNQLKDK